MIVKRLQTRQVLTVNNMVLELKRTIPQDESFQCSCTCPVLSCCLWSTQVPVHVWTCGLLCRAWLAAGCAVMLLKQGEGFFVLI